MPRRLLLIRHGRVDFEATGPEDFRGTPRGPQWDPPLDGRGREQAALLAARLASTTPPAAVFVSPYRRCLQTAEPFVRSTGIQPTVDEGLAEVFIGEWEGVRFEDLFAADADLIRLRVHEQEPMFNLAPGGETGSQLRARVVPTVERLLASVDGDEGNVLIIAHGGVINAYLGHVMDIEQDMFFIPENTSVNTIDVNGTGRRMRFINDVAHLAFPGIFVLPPGDRS